MGQSTQGGLQFFSASATHLPAQAALHNVDPTPAPLIHSDPFGISNLLRLG